MCGIAGVIGKSKHPHVSHQLATSLFERSESRGTDASGFWGCQRGEAGAVVYHKEPKKATSFVHGEAWRQLKGMDLNLLIMHARASSQGIGDAASNKNNHPFTNSDRSLGLVHNGRIYEYSTLKKRYAVKSDCDSEVLLRIFENARASAKGDIEDDTQTPADILSSTIAIRDIFSYVQNDSYMAVAIGERGAAGRRDLWLFHNERRPLWLVDAREALGQIFFCSTPDIWGLALKDCPNATAILGGRRHTILPMPTDEIWYFSVDDENPTVPDQGSGYCRFRLEGENEFTPWDDAGEKYPIAITNSEFPVLSVLGENDEIDGEDRIVPRNRHKNRNKNRGGIYEHTPPIVHWSKDGNARYEDEIDSREDRDYEDLRHECDDILDEDEEEPIRLDSRGSPHHGITPMKLDGSGLVPAENYAGKIGKNFLKNKFDNGYEDIPDMGHIDTAMLELTVSEIRTIAQDIETTLTGLAQEGSILNQTFIDHVESLDCILTDLRGTLHLIEKC